MSDDICQDVIDAAGAWYDARGAFATHVASLNLCAVISRLRRQPPAEEDCTLTETTTPGLADDMLMRRIIYSPAYEDFEQERERAHLKHADTSVEGRPWTDPAWLAILTEELGEVARALNDLRHGAQLGPDAAANMREELVQVGAMAAAWVDALDDGVAAS